MPPSYRLVSRLFSTFIKCQIFLLGAREEKRRKKMRKIFGVGKYMVSVHQEPPHSPPLLKSCTLIVPRCSEIFITAHNIIKSVDMELCCDEMMKIPKMAIIMSMLIIVVMVITMTIMIRWQWSLWWWRWQPRCSCPLEYAALLSPLPRIAHRSHTPDA